MSNDSEESLENDNYQNAGFDEFMDTWEALVLKLNFVENIPGRVMDDLIGCLSTMALWNLRHLRETFIEHNIAEDVQELCIGNMWICKEIFFLSNAIKYKFSRMVIGMLTLK